ncbi:MAG TPA: site-specific integrase [Clostridiales bacterium]|nr:site-specific integrase [Clostridiales bacterium]
MEDESGRQVQREFAGTESKSETEALLRKAMEDYEAKKFVAKSENATVGMLLDMWVEEELKPSNLSNGTVMAYTAAVKRIKQHPIGNRKLKTVTSDHLQAFIDFMSYGGTNPDGTTTQPLSKGYMLQFSAVLQGAFRFAVFPKRFITFNPMQYVKLRGRKDEADIFCEDEADTVSTPTITHEQYLKLTDYLKGKDNPALLPVQIAYYTGLRIGEVCGLTWQDINLDEQYLTVRRSMRYNGTRHKTEIGTTKRSKVRTVDFCDTLAAILRIAKMEQRKNRFKYGELYHLNYYKVVKEKDRSYYEVYNLPRTEQAPEGYKELSFVCVRPDGMFESSSAVGAICRKAKKEVEGLEDFHFHMLRHTYTSNLLSGGAKPTDVQELLGHSDVNTTMSIYAHATREAKRTSARLLDKVVGGE